MKNGPKMPTVNDPNEALRIDSSCEAAIAMLAQLNLQQSKIEKAEELFSRQAELARSEQELVNELTYHIRKKSDTYVGYIDLYRSIGWLGNPLLYRSS